MLLLSLLGCWPRSDVCSRRPEAGSLEKGAICLGPSECTTEDIHVVRRWVPSAEQEWAAAYKGLAFTLLSISLC